MRLPAATLSRRSQSAGQSLDDRRLDGPRAPAVPARDEQARAGRKKPIQSTGLFPADTRLLVPRAKRGRGPVGTPGTSALSASSASSRKRHRLSLAVSEMMRRGHAACCAPELLTSFSGSAATTPAAATRRDADVAATEYV